MRATLALHGLNCKKQSATKLRNQAIAHQLSLSPNRILHTGNLFVFSQNYQSSLHKPKIHFLYVLKFFQFYHSVFITATTAVYVFVTCEMFLCPVIWPIHQIVQIWLFYKLFRYLSCFCNRPFRVIPQLSASVLQYVRLEYLLLILNVSLGFGVLRLKKYTKLPILLSVFSELTNSSPTKIIRKPMFLCWSKEGRN